MTNIIIHNIVNYYNVLKYVLLIKIKSILSIKGGTEGEYCLRQGGLKSLRRRAELKWSRNYAEGRRNKECRF